MYKPAVNISDQRWQMRIQNALPAFMNQKDDSNNQKVLSIYSDFGNQYKNDILNLTDQTLVKHASGAMLDRLCKDWGVHIIDEYDDEFKRFQIRFQMIRHRLGIGTNDIKGAIALLFDIPESSFRIMPAGIKDIRVEDVPFNFHTKDKSELKRKLIAKYIRNMMPPEYQLKGIVYRKINNINYYYGITSSHIDIDRFSMQPKINIAINYSNYDYYGINSNHLDIDRHSSQPKINISQNITDRKDYGLSSHHLLFRNYKQPK